MMAITRLHYYYLQHSRVIILAKLKTGDSFIVSIGWVDVIILEVVV